MESWTREPANNTFLSSPPASLSRRTFLTGVAATTGFTVLPGTAAKETSSRATDDLSPQSTRRPPDFETFLDDLIPAQLDDHDIAGATVAVVADGDLQVANGYGYADVETEQPVRADETLFNLASVSKAITGTAVMRAVEDGLVNLDTDVNTYLDGFGLPERYPDPITLEHLGTHSAGFAPQHIGEYTYDEQNLRPLNEGVAKNPPVRVRPPGEIASYSNYGFALAGHIIAATADTTFADYVRQHVFDPLGMQRSTVHRPRPDEFAEAMSKGYAVEDGEFKEQDVRVSWRLPAGGVAATATDMAAFMLMHLQGGQSGDNRFLPAETVEGMHAERFENHPAIDSVGYGFIEETRGDARFVGMTGDGDTFQSAMALFPDRDIGLFVAYNTRGGGAARTELIDAFVETYAPPGEPAALEPDGQPARADDLEGSYRHTRMAERSVAKVIGAAATLQVRVADDGMLVTEPEVPGPSSRWVEVEPLVFRKVDDHDRLAFREEDGEITYAFMSPRSGLERLHPHQRTLAHLAITAGFLVTFLGGLFGWIGRGVWRRYRGKPPSGGRPFALRLLAGLTGAALLSIFVAGIVLLVGAGTAASILTGLPLWFQVALGLPTIGAVGAVAMLAGGLLAWRERYWSVASRIHYTVLALSSLAFAWVLAYWNLMWTPL
jgi:CubicO group peptidase (beta-lactamase class C family)